MKRRRLGRRDGVWALWKRYLVAVCSDCHDEVEGPADGAWERVVRHKADIKAGRIAKTRQERLNEKRECQAREREYEKARADRKRKALDAMGMIADENPMPPSLSELEAKRRSQGYLDPIDGRRYWSLAFGEERARLLFDAPRDEYVQSIVERARGCAS